MEYWLTWVIVLAIGLAIGFIVHALIRYSQGTNILATVLAGMLGAIVGAFVVGPALGITFAAETLDMLYVWAVIGALVLSIIVELLFAATRRGHIVTS